MQFSDRRDAGRALAARLAHYANNPEVLVLALPRGGVPVAYEVACALRATLDVFVVRKLGVPGHEEYAMGAIASGGIRVMNPDAIRLGIPQGAVEAVMERERVELERRERLYRGGRPAPHAKGRIVILVDDGLATGSTMRAAAAAVRQQDPQRIVIAVPVGAADVCNGFRNEVDEVVCAITPEPFNAVGPWFADFTQTTDDEVCALLAAAAPHDASHPV